MIRFNVVKNIYAFSHVRGNFTKLVKSIIKWLFLKTSAVA